MDDRGRLQAVAGVGGDRDLPYSAVCPFGDDAPSETEVARSLFATSGGATGLTWDDRIGASALLLAGHVAEETYQARGASGGMGSWILCQLLERGLVDAIIHVVSEPGDERLFRYRISSSIDEVRQGSHSAYYPVEMSEMLRAARQSGRRHAIVGIPCFVKAVRLLARADPAIRAAVPYCVGIFSGHLKSTDFAAMLGWEVGIAPGELSAIDFRTKLPDPPASRYAMTATGPSGSVVQPMADVYGHEWGMGFFKYPACDSCDDVAAETADIAIGDAWLPEFASDPRGSNVVIVREPKLVAIVRDAVRDGRLSMVPITADDVVRSQRGAFRHRRELLPDRLALADARGVWRPKTRSTAKAGTPEQRELNLARERIRDASPQAMAAARSVGQLRVLKERMDPLIQGFAQVRPRATSANRGGGGRLSRLLGRRKG